MNNENKGIASVALAALLWGSLGLFGKTLNSNGVMPIAVVAIRILIAFVFLLIYWIFIKREKPKIKRSDIPLLLLYTLLSVIAYNFLYFSAISLIPIAVAAILLYLSPIFVVFLSSIFLGEKLTSQKIIATAIVLFGTILVVNPQNFQNINLMGILFGIGSGLTFALYSLLGKKLTKNNDTVSIVTYSFGLGSIGLIAMAMFSKQISISYSFNSWILLLILGLIPTLLAFVSYNSGLKKIEASKASIISTLEPVVAAILGFFVLSERLSISQIAGVIVVIIGVIFISYKKSSS